MSEKKSKFIFIFVFLAFFIVVVLAAMLKNEEKDDQTTTSTSEETSQDKVESNISDTEAKELMQYLIPYFSKFYEENYELTRLISKNGFLYNKASESKLTTEYMYERYDLYEKDKILAGADVLLLKPEDLASKKELKSKSGFHVYISYEMSNGNYTLVSEYDEESLTKEAYTELLSKYSSEHGKIVKHKKGSTIYNNTLQVVKNKESYKKDPFIRYLVSDDKYLCVVFSPREQYKEIKQVVLEYKNDKWSYVLEGLEKESRLYVEINRQIPDLNLELIPKYTIANESSFMFDEFDKIDSHLKKISVLDNSAGEIVFASGTDEFLYMEYKNKKKFFGILEDGVWQVDEIESSLDAEKIMLSHDEEAALFILIQE